MGTGCRFPPNRPLALMKDTQDWTFWRTVDTAPLRKTLLEKRKKRTPNGDRKKTKCYSGLDPSAYLKQTVSAPHAHMHPESRRALVYKMDYPRFQTFSLVSIQSLITHFNSRESSHSLEPPSFYQSTSISLIEIIQSFEKIEYILSSQTSKHSSF